MKNKILKILIIVLVLLILFLTSLVIYKKITKKEEPKTNIQSQLPSTNIENQNNLSGAYKVTRKNEVKEVVLEEDMTAKYADSNQNSKVKNGTYTVSGNQLVISINNSEKYLFTFNEDGTLTSNDGTTDFLIFSKVDKSELRYIK